MATRSLTVDQVISLNRNSIRQQRNRTIRTDWLRSLPEKARFRIEGTFTHHFPTNEQRLTLSHQDIIVQLDISGRAAERLGIIEREVA